MSNFIKHFDLEELVHPSFIKIFGPRCRMFLQQQALATLVQMRELLGPITVNNWHVGGNYELSGLRPSDTSIGAKYSIHKYGGAFDCKFRDVTPREAQEYILTNSNQFPLLRRMENVDFTPTWLHFDVANTGVDDIIVFNP